MVKKPTDRILKTFLTQQFAETQKLSDQSDIVEVVPVEGQPPSKYLIRFINMPYFSRTDKYSKVKQVQRDIIVAVSFPEDYLKSVSENLFLRIACLLNTDFFHPNVKPGVGWICLGQAFIPGTTLSDLIYSIYEIINYTNITVDERNAYNFEACFYFRNAPDLLDKLERPPLRRQKSPLKIKVTSLNNKTERE